MTTDGYFNVLRHSSLKVVPDRDAETATFRTYTVVDCRIVSTRNDEYQYEWNAITIYDAKVDLIVWWKWNILGSLST